MKTKRKSTGILGAIIAAICIIIYIFALIQAGVRIYFSVEERRMAAEKEFSNIAIIAQTAGAQSFMDEQFIETINKALSANRSIEALIISGPEGEYAFERQKGYAVAWANNSPRFINRISFSNENYYRPLQIRDLRNANIRAVAGAFNFDEISKILKETLILILAGLAIAFFTMLLQLLIGKPDEKYAEVKTPSPEQYVRETPKQYEQTQFKEKEEPVVVRNIAAEKESEPKGLYSPRSNIGWEEYTKDRLNSEIHRCSSTEKDISLVLIEFADITNDLMYKLAAEEAISFFSSRDLLFEYGKLGILVILPGIELGAGISKSEKFYQRIVKKFPNKNPSLCIGLSSRSGRLINADRLMMEAQEALSKAKRDIKSPIIAFKSDPEKYRAFIASQN